MNDAKLEWLIPFVILAVMFIPRIFKGTPAESLNELVIILLTCVLIGIVISVLRHIKKLEKE